MFGKRVGLDSANFEKSFLIRRRIGDLNTEVYHDASKLLGRLDESSVLRIMSVLVTSVAVSVMVGC